MPNPYSPGRTPCATPPPTTFVENAYWQLIMAGWATVEACRRVRITEISSNLLGSRAKLCYSRAAVSSE
jgi:hypothetical protein